MEKTILRIISAGLAATLAMHLEKGNHIDLYTEFDVDMNDASETIAIQFTYFFDTPVYLMGGYGAGVRKVDVPNTDTFSDEEIHRKIVEKLVEFLEDGQYFCIEENQLNNFPLGIFSKTELMELAHADIIELSV